MNIIKNKMKGFEFSLSSFAFFILMLGCLRVLILWISLLSMVIIFWLGIVYQAIF